MPRQSSGNEIDGPWQLGHKNAEEYSKFALEAGKAMRSTDNSIKLIASGSSNYGPTADTGGLFQNKAPVIYRYASVDDLLQREARGGENPPLPGPGANRPTERP